MNQYSTSMTINDNPLLTIVNLREWPLEQPCITKIHDRFDPPAGHDAKGTLMLENNNFRVFNATFN